MTPSSPPSHLFWPPPPPPMINDQFLVKLDSLWNFLYVNFNSDVLLPDFHMFIICTNILIMHMYNSYLEFAVYNVMSYMSSIIF